MSSAIPNKKRKLDSRTERKERRRPSKKFKRHEYHSDSEDDEDQVTARDAPKPDPATDGSSGTKSSAKASGSNAVLVSKDTIKRKEGKKARVATIPKQRSTKDDAELAPSSTKEPVDGDISDDNEDDDDEGELEADDASADSGSGSDSSQSSTSQATSSTRPKSKRHDPTAFATSISAILGSSLSRSKRSDPVLSRSKDAADISKALSEEKLDVKARKQLVAERRLAKEKGRVRDVLIGDRKATLGDDAEGEELAGQGGGMTAAVILVQEKQLRKLAQRGVVKLFNAVRAAQVRGEEESRKAKKEGVVGMANREEKVKTMSKNAFLDLVGAGGVNR